ncbi:MAG: hypothetical protein AAF845_04935 [Bacteroidota bacterium]
MRLSHLALFVAAGSVVLAACAAPPATGPVDTGGIANQPVLPPEDGPEYGPGDYCADTIVLIQPTVRSNFSLGSEYIRNDDFCAAYPYMRWMLDNEPLFTGEDPDDRNFLRMARIYEDFAAQVDSTNRDEQKAYLDSALMSRRDGIAAMDAAGVTYDRYLRDLQEGFFFFQNRAFYEDAESQQFAAFQRAFEAQPDSLEDWYLGELFNTSASAFPVEDGAANPERAAFVRTLATYVDNDESQEFYTTFADAIENPASAGFTGSDAAVEALISDLRGGTISDDDALVLLAVILQQPDRLEALGEDVAALRTDVLRLEAVTSRVEDPNTLAALAFQAYREGDTARGNGLFDRAIENAESNAQRADFYYSRRQSGDINNALRVFPSHGPSLYQRAVNIGNAIGRPTTLRGRFAYWCVADEFRNVAARTTDSRIARTARTAAARYERSGPSREQYFLAGFQPGQTVSASLGAYGRCSTRVR